MEIVEASSMITFKLANHQINKYEIGDHITMTVKGVKDNYNVKGALTRICGNQLRITNYVGVDSTVDIDDILEILYE